MVRICVSEVTFKAEHWPGDMNQFFVLFLLALFSSAVQAQVGPPIGLAPPPGGRPQSNGMLGESVAIDGNLILTGETNGLTSHDGIGLVKVFNSSAGALLHVLENPTLGGDDFGAAVAISGNLAVVGAPLDSHGSDRDGSAYVYDLASFTPTEPIAVLHNPTPDGSDFFGFSVAISGSLVVVGEYNDDGGAVNTGSVYVYDMTMADPTVPAFVLNNPTPAASDGFGWSVGISGTKLVVGARRDDADATDAGCAYVYELAGTLPTQPTLTLLNPSPAVNDYFGMSVAISGPRVVVGVSEDDTGASNSGLAYVYDVTRPVPTVPMATLPNPSPVSNDRFGRSVAISGPLVLVGSYLDDTGATNAGSAYVFNMTAGSPGLPVHSISNPEPAPDDWFGYAIGISGSHIVAGAINDDKTAANAGSAYVYDLLSTSPAFPVAVLNKPGPDGEEAFGHALAVSGTKLVVGANGSSEAAQKKGIAYVYDSASSQPLLPILTLMNPAAEINDGFGSAVAISGTRIVIGVPGESSSEFNSGRVCVYDLPGLTPALPVFTLDNPTPAEDDAFGSTVAISGPWVIVGVDYDDTFGNNAGIVYVYNLTSPMPTTPVFTLAPPSPSTSLGFFGRKVAVSGSLLLVGDVTNRIGQYEAGSAYVYNLDSLNSSAPILTLHNPSPGANDLFGGALAISGTRLVIGASSDSFGATVSGSVYVYDISSTTPTVPIATIHNPLPENNSEFGLSVAISGTQVVVGVPEKDDGDELRSGIVYAYDVAGPTPAVPMATLTNPTPNYEDQFGFAVAIEGGKIYVGAPCDDTVVSNKGYAYIYSILSPLELWRQQHFGTTANLGNAANSFDFDNDGIPNLMEWGANLNPKISNVFPQRLTLTALGWEYEYPRSVAAVAAGAGFSVEWSDTLGLRNHWKTMGVTETMISSDGLTQQMRAIIPATTAGRCFTRLRVFSP